MTHPNQKLFLLQKYFAITWDACKDHVKISLECRSNQVWKLTTCLLPSWYLSRLRFGLPAIFIFARKVIGKARMKSPTQVSLPFFELLCSRSCFFEESSKVISDYS